MKGLGILLVYLGHTISAGSKPFRVIFFVHMPLFFAMEQNASHVFTVILRACGINAPEVYYMVSGMIGLKIARMVFCLLVVALIAPAVGALVRKIQERVEGGLQWVN